jgi:uncharacterized repeat protein (TIGR01451 family)
VGILGLLAVLLTTDCGRLSAAWIPIPGCVPPAAVPWPEGAGLGALPPFAHEPAAATPGPEDPPVPVVAIQVRVPATAALGQELQYHFCAENRSPAAAHHVLVRSPLPTNIRYVRADPEPSARTPELVWQLGTLGPGVRRDLRLVVVPTGPGDVNLCARVQFEHGQCVCTKIAQPGLQVRKQGPSQAVLNDALSYQLTVTNTGSTELTGVVLTDTLPTGLEHATGKNPLTWEVGTLAPGQSRQVAYQVVATKVGRLCNQATATAAGGLRDQAESCVTVGEAKLGLTKTGLERRYTNTGSAYQIIVSNPGTLPLANVAITDPLPPGTTFVSASSGGQLAGNEVRWTIGPLAPGENRTVDVVLRAQSEGRICNRATATAERGLTAEAEACTEFIGLAALSVEVVHTEDPVEVGAETSYAILVRNRGTTPVNEVRIVALVPEQMQVIRATGPSDNRKDGPKLVFEPLTLPPKGEARYVVYVKALAPGDVRFKVDLMAQELTAGPVHEEESTTIYTDVPATRRPPEGVRQGRAIRKP